MSPNPLTEWIQSIPPVTRFLFFSILGANIFFPMTPFVGSLILTRQAIWDFQLWRLFTAGIFIGGRSFALLMLLFMIYQYSSQLERVHFAFRRADYVFCVVFIWTILSVAALLLHEPVFASGINIALIYIWAQFNKDAIVTFYFGLRFQAIFLPWAFIAMSYLMGGLDMMLIVGCGVGHLYWYLEHEAPVQYGTRILKTPAIFHSWFDEREVAAAPARELPIPVGPAGRPVAAGGARGGHNWGQGQVLGN